MTLREMVKRRLPGGWSLGDAVRVECDTDPVLKVRNSLSGCEVVMERMELPGRACIQIESVGGSFTISERGKSGIDAFRALLRRLETEKRLFEDLCNLEEQSRG